MTEEEKKIWREKKAEAAEVLSAQLGRLGKVGGLGKSGQLGRLDQSEKVEQSGHSGQWGEIWGTDERIGEYVREVAGDMEGHNLYEVLGVIRFLRMGERWRWNRKRVRRFVRFYEMLRFSGVSGRCRYRLTPVQVFQFANIMGWDDDEGNRLTRVAYLFVPRKYGKTTSVAALAVYDMLFGDNNAQAYVGANSYQQAKICFDEIRAIMRDIDPRGRHLRVNREKIIFEDRGRDSFIRCLSNNPKTLDGLNASLVIMDEYAQARNTANKNGADLKNALTSSMGARREPLTVVITTASEVVDGPFYHELEGVMGVLDREVNIAEPLGKLGARGARGALSGARGENGDRMFASLFMPDADDEEGDERTWAKVQPHLGVTVKRDFYRNEWEAAQLSAEGRLAFRTKLLNVWTVNEQKMWMGYDEAMALLGDWDIDRAGPGANMAKPLDGAKREMGLLPCAVAFDLSVHDDFSAVSYTVYVRKERHFYCHTDYYFPREALEGHPNKELYKEWAEKGYLKLCEGKKIDVRMIADDILRRAKKVKIIRIGYDAYKAQDLVNTLRSVGGESVLQSYGQTYGNFNLPVESFELLAYSDPPRITLNNNPINAWCLCNCVIDEDRLENKKPVKASQYRKIDGVITMLMTLGQMYSYGGGF